MRLMMIVMVRRMVFDASEDLVLERVRVPSRSGYGTLGKKCVIRARVRVDNSFFRQYIVKFHIVSIGDVEVISRMRPPCYPSEKLLESLREHVLFAEYLK